MSEETIYFDMPSLKIEICEHCSMPLGDKNIMFGIGITEVNIPNFKNPRIKIRYKAHSGCENNYNRYHFMLDRFRNASPELLMEEYNKANEVKE